MESWIILLVLAAIAVFFVVLYNRLVALRQGREQSFADIDVQLRQRYDLVPQLVETVKGYAEHEQKVFDEVTKARAGIDQASDTGQRVAAENAMTEALIDLNAVAEAYPDLKANQNFQDLQRELSDIENKIAAARRFFNNATAELNTAIEQFPAVLIAGPLGFKQEEFFELDDTQRAAMEEPPKVGFGS